ncbi:hypothetical protein FKM82_001229, partial [Ascaphus truei]
MLLLLCTGCCCCSAQVYNLSLSVDEGLPPGTLVGDIRAGLPEGSSGEGFFLSEEGGESPVLRDLQVDTETGIVRTLRALDRERRGRYSFVAATLRGEVVQVEIRVRDVNDHPPAFPTRSVRLQVSELTPPGTTFRLPPARDPDTGEHGLRGYTLRRGSQGAAFTIRYGEGKQGAGELGRARAEGQEVGTDSEEEGQVEGAGLDPTLHPLDLVLMHWLDREELDRYQLEVEAFDGGHPCRTGRLRVDITVLDANDNPPTFDRAEYMGWVWESAPPGTPICTVHATDPDLGSNGEVSYSLRSGEGYFTVEESSGVVQVNRPLDREQRAIHQLVVQARDGGAQPEVSSILVTVRVLDVNDNNPHIHITLLTDSGQSEVSEGARSGEYLARISVSDPDLESEEEPGEGGEGLFSLRPAGPQLFFLCVEGPLDRELQDLYELRLVAWDSGSPPLQSHRTLLLRVTDLNDQPPIFHQPDGYHATISEAASAGTVVLRLSTQDLDEDGPNSSVTYTLQDSPSSVAFLLDPHTGVLSIARTLDHEAEPVLNLVVVATDNGSPPLSSSCPVTIMVEDINDNEPVFLQQFYNVSLQEHTPIGYCFLQ